MPCWRASSRRPGSRRARLPPPGAHQDLLRMLLPSPRVRAALLMAALTVAAGVARAADPGPDPCPRPAPGAAVTEPHALRSDHGVLRVALTLRNVREPDGSLRYCYLLADGTQSPTLRLAPGDTLILTLKNALSVPAPEPAGAPAHTHMTAMPAKPATAAPDPCTSGAMTPLATNLHFHGLTLPPLCHQDDVLEDLDPAAGRAVRVSLSHSRRRATGPLLVSPAHSRLQHAAGAGRGLGRAHRRGHSSAPTRAVAGLPERVLVIRDQDLLNPERSAVEIRAGRAEDCSSTATATRPTTAPGSASRRRICRSTSCRCPTPTTRRRCCA